MLASQLRRRYVGSILLTLVVLMMPVSVAYAPEAGEKRAEKFVELAERAGEKVGNFIDIIYANETAIDTITHEGLIDELEGNKTLYEEWGLGNLTEARDALEAGDYAGAITNATEALTIFRNVFKALNSILEEAGVARGQLIDAQGLIEAMKRALERIERLREIAPPEVLAILEAAEEYLDVTTAIAWLREGRVNETAWNMTQGNRLISLAHSLLKGKAAELKDKRLEGYLKLIENLYDRLERLAEKAGATDLLERLTGEAKPLVEGARDAYTAGEYATAIAKLVEARNILSEIERDLLEFRRAG